MYVGCCLILILNSLIKLHISPRTESHQHNVFWGGEITCKWFWWFRKRHGAYVCIITYYKSSLIINPASIICVPLKFYDFTLLILQPYSFLAFFRRICNRNLGLGSPFERRVTFSWNKLLVLIARQNHVIFENRTRIRSSLLAVFGFLPDDL